MTLIESRPDTPQSAWNQAWRMGAMTSVSCQCQKVLALLHSLDKLRGLAQDGGASRSIATTNGANRKHHKVLTKR
ncbi:hypothetical protein, partial [Xanthomonas arboricola]|uniref:hypothetical protein n=1 Tax=Xanthomonas arboricola TaxID=56448 RepID=UPI0035E69C9B